MKHNLRPIHVALCIVIASLGLLFMDSSTKNMRALGTLLDTHRNNSAAVFFTESITSQQLRQKYADVSDTQNDDQSTTTQKIRILVVPGHEPSYGGTVFRDTYEKDINVDLSNELATFLKGDHHYDIVVARDKTAWDPVFETYFTQHATDIQAFYETQKNIMTELIDNGNVTKITDGIAHNSAPPDTALHLYGINKWASENDIDIVLHVHFNDYPRKKMTLTGIYSGFSIYIPERQYSNSSSTRAVTETIFKRLATFYPVSDMPKEDAGIIEDQDLIAIGKYNTSDAPSILIEYGYIYEPHFLDRTVQHAVLKDMAFQTFLGIRDFFEESATTTAYDTTLVPYVWNTTMNRTSYNKRDTLSLQTALTITDMYPPQGKTHNDCPLSGSFGPCTQEAITRFQKENALTDPYGTFGPKTREFLNRVYETSQNTETKSNED